MIDETNTEAVGTVTVSAAGIIGEHCSTVERKKPTGGGKGNALITFTDNIQF